MDHIADTVTDKDLQPLYPMEFLNSLSPSGLPVHHLRLKPGLPIMLLRNLNGARGLAHGTRLICRRFLPRLIEAQVVTGTRKGNNVYLPRVIFDCNDLDTPFPLRRRQFPSDQCLP